MFDSTTCSMRDALPPAPMKSAIKESHCEMPGVFGWQRVVFDNSELKAALKENRLESLVRSVLRTQYADYTILPLLVDDVMRTVLRAFADLMSERDLCVLMAKSAVDSIQKTASDCRQKMLAKSKPYWVGENAPIKMEDDS